MHSRDSYRAGGSATHGFGIAWRIEQIAWFSYPLIEQAGLKWPRRWVRTHRGGRVMRKQLPIIAFLLAAGIDASAQEFTGSIYGRIVDPTNALLPGVSITVEGAAIQGQRTAESEANGSYRFVY